jgi:hypothetical protein
MHSTKELWERNQINHNEVPDETLHRIESDTQEQARAKVQLIEHRLERKFDSAVDPKMTLVGVWCILQGVDIGEQD